jgi:hypothetical protein
MKSGGNRSAFRLGSTVLDSSFFPVVARPQGQVTEGGRNASPWKSFGRKRPLPDRFEIGKEI